MEGLLLLVAAVAAAATLAYGLNRLLLRLWGMRRALTTAPWLEETLKTGAAWLFGAPLVVVHLGFGVVEAVYDAWQAPRKQAVAGLLSLLSHGVFGLVTWLVARWTAALWAGALAAAALHWAWNSWVLQGRVPGTRR